MLARHHVGLGGQFPQTPPQYALRGSESPNGGIQRPVRQITPERGAECPGRASGRYYPLDASTVSQELKNEKSVRPTPAMASLWQRDYLTPGVERREEVRE